MLVASIKFLGSLALPLLARKLLVLCRRTKNTICCLVKIPGGNQIKKHINKKISVLKTKLAV